MKRELHSSFDSLFSYCCTIRIFRVSRIVARELNREDRAAKNNSNSNKNKKSILITFEE